MDVDKSAARRVGGNHVDKLREGGLEDTVTLAQQVARPVWFSTIHAADPDDGRCLRGHAVDVRSTGSARNLSEVYVNDAES